MARPKRLRLIETPPVADGFKPFGFPMAKLEPVIILYEEYESIRLSDYLRLTHAEAARQMRVSRPTFTRIYDHARKSVAEAFMEGKAILFEGGNYHSDNYWYKCTQCMKLVVSIVPADSCQYCNGHQLRRLNNADHRTTINKSASDFCICVKCGLKMPHEKGSPCRQKNCPDCGKKMMREGSYHHQLFLKKTKE